MAPPTSVPLAVWALLLLATPCVGWDCAGHMMTAEAALRWLSPEHRAWYGPAMAYMRNYGFLTSSDGEVACWPDDLRNYTDFSYPWSNWHYAALCWTATQADQDAYCANFSAATQGGRLVEALAAARRGLESAMLAGPEQVAAAGFWLGWVMHLTGDAHQPLHWCTQFNAEFPQGNRGANAVLVGYDPSAVTPGATPTGQLTWINLHSFYDSQGGTTNYTWPPRPIAASPPAVAAVAGWGDALQAWLHDGRNRSFVMPPGVPMDMPPEGPPPESVLSDTNVADWEQEVVALCMTVYMNGSMANGTVLTPAYVALARTMLAGQVAIGGARLGAILAGIHANVQEAQAPLLSTTAIILIAVGGGIVVVLAAGLIASRVRRHARRGGYDRTGEDLVAHAE